MADLIDRQAALELQYIGYKRVADTDWQEGFWDGVDDICDKLRKLPAVDAVEVVRRKDCVRCGFCGEATNLEVMGFYGYCSRGKRREENHLTFASMEDVVNESD